MQTSPRRQVLGFAHRGDATAPGERNTLAAFERALYLGAQGLETDIGMTADGIPVLIHAGLTLRRRTAVSDLRRDQLPATIPTLADLYDRCGTNFDLSLDMAQPRAAEAVVRLADARGARHRLWLTYWRMPEHAEWRARWPDIRLVYPTMPILPGSISRLLPRLAAVGVDALNVHHRFCTPGLARAAHAQGIMLFAWGIRKRVPLKRVLAHDIDGVYCDDVAALVELTAP